MTTLIETDPEDVFKLINSRGMRRNSDRVFGMWFRLPYYYLTFSNLLLDGTLGTLAEIIRSINIIFLDGEEGDGGGTEVNRTR